MIVFYSLLFQSIAQAQTNQSSSVSNSTVITTGESLLQNKLDQLETKTTAEINSLNERLADSHTLFISFGAISGFLLTFLTIWSVIREQRHHKDYREERSFYEERVRRIEDSNREDYKRERKFYEESATAVENRQSTSFKLALESLQATNKRESASASAQLDNVVKLGGVIALVRQTFEMQLKREEAQSSLLTNLKETDDIVTQFKVGFHNQYKEAADHLMELSGIKAMEWTMLSDEEQGLATRSRTKLEGIPAFVLTEERQKDPPAYAKVMQLAGISAFYANDINFAIQRLEESELAAKDDSRPETSMSRAYTKHFLGLAFKNWCFEGTPISKNIEKSAQYLKDAYEAVKNEKRQFLIPVTYAEILSHQHNTQENAKQLLNEILERFASLHDAGEVLNTNQKTLLIRAHLLKGNISFRSKQFSDALDQYELAYRINTRSPFSLLSVLQCKQELNMPVKLEDWKGALLMLDASGAHTKREIPSRVLALSWGLIASVHAENDERVEKISREFDSIGRNIRSVAHRFPIFFSPISKELLTFADLKLEIDNFANKATESKKKS